MVLKKLNEAGHARKDEEFYTLTAKESAEWQLSFPGFDETEVQAKVTAIFEKKENSKEALQQELGMLIQEKLSSIKTLNSQLEAMVASCRAVYKKRDDMMMEKLRLEEESEKVETDYKEKADLCRSLQSKTKEYEELSKKILEDEIKKTEEMKVSFTDSISSILANVEAEEAGLTTSQEENESLSTKITEFQGHLQTRADHMDATKKARGIERQLLAAKEKQHFHAEQQRVLTSEQYQQHLVQLKQTEMGLQLQYEITKENLGNSTFKDTAQPVFLQCEEQLGKMMLVVDEDRQEIERTLMAQAEKEQKLEKIKRCTAAARKKIEEVKAEQVPLQERCRELQARRNDLTKALAAKNASAQLALSTQAVQAFAVATSVALGEVILEDAVVMPEGRGETAAATVSAPSSSSGSPTRNCNRHTNSSSPGPTPPSSSSRTPTSGEERTQPGEDTPSSSPVVTGKRRG